MNRIKKGKLGLAFGILLGLCHAIWALMVLFGWAQPFYDWILSLHFISLPLVVTSFSLGTAILLVVITFVIGYILGWVFAAIWNKFIVGKEQM